MMDKVRQMVEALPLQEQQQLMVDVIKHSSPEVQLSLLLPSVTAAASYVKWRLVTNLQGQDTPDLLYLLPPELQMEVLSYVDGVSLLRASQVSRTWNRIIKNHSELWMKQCRRLGVNMAQVPVGVDWQKTHVTSLRQQESIRIGTAFTERLMQLQNCKKAVKAVDYKDGYLCTVSEEDYINIWQLDLNIPVMTFPVERVVSCIKFHPGSLLVCGHFMGILTSWDLSGMSDAKRTVREHTSGTNRDQYNLRNKFRMHAGPVFSCDFSEDLDLLVSGGADECLKLWSLSLGVQVKSLPNQDHWVLKVILIPDMTQSSNNEIIYMTRENVRKISWPSSVKGDGNSDTSKEGAQGTVPSPAERYGEMEKISHNFKISLNEGHTNFFTPGLQFSSKYIGIIKQDVEEKHANLCIFNIVTFKLEHNISLNIKVKKLLALGNRFALLLTKGTVLYSSTLVILDIITTKIIGTRSIPHSKMTTPDGAQLVVGDVKWLDGLGSHLPGPANASHTQSSSCGANAGSCDASEQKLLGQGCQTEVSGNDTNKVMHGNENVDLQQHLLSCPKEKLRLDECGSKSCVSGKVDEEEVNDCVPCCDCVDQQNTSDVGMCCKCTSDHCQCIMQDTSQEVNVCQQPEQPSFLVLAAGVLNEPGRLFTLWWAHSKHTRKCKEE